MTDAELVNRILAGEERLFAELVKRYAGCVWAICSAHIFNRTDCEDVAQDVFVQCYLRLSTLRRRAAFGLWLSQIARHRCRDWLRAASRRKAAMTRYEQHARHDGVRAAADDGRRVERAELHGTIDALVHTLPPKTRETMLLCYGEGYSPAQAAELLGVSHDAVKKRLRYGRKLLAAKVGNEIEPALAAKRHTEDFTRAALAAIPFGNAAWLGTAGAGTAAATKVMLTGGITVMSKKLVIGIAGALLLLALTLSLTDWSGKDAAEEQHREAVAPAGLPESALEPVIESESQAPPAEEPPSPVAEAPALEEGGQTSSGQEAEPVQPASISGYVRDSDGYPFDSASIQLEIVREADLNVIYTAQTGSNGMYEIDDIDAFGDASVFASADGYVMQRSRLELSPGTRRDDVDFTLPQAVFIVAGWVVSGSNSPIPGASVGTPHYGYSEEGFQRMVETDGLRGRGDISGSKYVFAITDEKGHFEVAIPEEGFSDFTVTADGYGTGYFPRVHTGTEDAVFVLRSGGAIAGKVTRTDGEHVEGATVEVVGEVFPGGLHLGVQSFETKTTIVCTDFTGDYLAEGLGEDYVYTVSVSEPVPDHVTELPAERGLRYIAGMMRAFDGTEVLSAQKSGIRVKSARTTHGVDLVLGSKSSATVYGVVTDRTTGAPVCPVVVEVFSVDEVSDEHSGSEAQHTEKYGGTVVTNLDGSYALLIPSLDERHSFGVSYLFMTEGGSAWKQPEEEVATLELGPGDEEELNFTVDAPVVVPVRYVNETGVPLEGVRAGIRETARGRGGCGGETSDAEGRFTFHGIPPFVSLQALAYKITQNDIKTIGVSEPFTGRPGETIPEVVVVCWSTGGIEGVVVDSAGNPVANAEIACSVLPQNSPMANEVQETATTMTDANGAFCILDALPAGVHPKLFVGCAQLDQSEPAVIDNVQIVADTVTNVGIIRLDQQLGSLEEGTETLGVE